MNVIDLELYKWQLHRLGAFNTVKIKSRSMGFSKFAWWQDCGAFTSIIPRRSGKTEMLIRMAKILQHEGEDFLFVVPTKNMANEVLIRSCFSPKKVEAVECSMFWFHDLYPTDTNLLIDEYNEFSKEILVKLFELNWKSISMAGSLKL